MKAVLTYITMIENRAIEQTRLFDTATARKICDVKNSFGNTVQDIYITEKGIIFLHNVPKDTLEIPNQKKIKEWVGENEPDKYIKFFGEVEEG